MLYTGAALVALGCIGRIAVCYKTDDGARDFLEFILLVGVCILAVALL